MRPAVVRAKLNEPISSLPSFTIGKEACSGVHYRVRLMAPKFVVLYRPTCKRGKNDAAAAAAICEAL